MLTNVSFEQLGPEHQIREGIVANSKIISAMSQQKHVVTTH